MIQGKYRGRGGSSCGIVNLFFLVGDATQVERLSIQYAHDINTFSVRI